MLLGLGARNQGESNLDKEEVDLNPSEIGANPILATALAYIFSTVHARQTLCSVLSANVASQ